jgi:endonuclease YncB( thermonuclease family)
MTDIVERLRSVRVCEDFDLLEEAAAKIERLTEDRAYWSHLCERHSIALALIATPPRPDGTWNRDRQACYELAREALERTP